MSIFLERKLKSTCVTCLCWKQTSPSYLAVGTTSGSVEFYWSDCTPCNFPNLCYQSRTSKSRHVTSLTFHPIYDILIVIWSDGVMRSWNCDKGTISSQMSPHSVTNDSYLNVLFNLNGTRLISTDYRGVVSIWSCKNNGSLNLLYTFKLKHGCSHISLYHTDNSNGADAETISAFYLSNNQGKIYLATDDGHCNDILELELQRHEDEDEDGRHFRLLQYIASHHKLIFITQDMMLYIYNVLNNDMNALSLDKSFKLSIVSNNVNVICIYLFDGLIAICNEQLVLHIFDVINNDNYLLSLADSRHMAAPNDTIDRLQFIESTKVLIGITCKSRIVLWKYSEIRNESCSENDWNILPPIALSQSIQYIDAGLSSHFYNANDMGIAVFDDELKVFCETKLHEQYCNGYCFVQFAPNRLLIYLSDDKMKKIRTPFTILILATAGNLVFVSNGEQAQLYRMDSESAPVKVYEWKEMLCSLASISFASAASADIIVCYHNNIRIYSCNGSLKTTLTFQQHEGFPITMDLNLSILAVVTTENILKVWHLKAETTPKSIIPQRKLDEYVSGVHSIKLNATANKISILSFDVRHILYLYDIEKDECDTFELEENVTIQQVIWEENDGRFLSVFWRKLPYANGTGAGADSEQTSSSFDANEIDELQTKAIALKSTRRASMLEMTESEAECASEIGFGVVSFFIAPDGKILPQEMFPTKWRFIGLAVPDFIFISTAKTDTHKIIRKRIRDFIGINNIDEKTKRNLMNFSYFLTVGDLDEAYRSVQNIKSSSVWENMARMCVKTRRLDVAQICISNLSSSRGTSARIASSLILSEGIEDDDDGNDDSLRLAMVAIDLKMYEDAEELLKQCGRYDLVVKMYQALGRWTSAIEICDKHDRVHLNASYYQYAMYLQQSGKLQHAIEFYEKSDCSLKIAEMLYQHNHIKLLQNYVNKSSDVKLLKWFAQYLESNEDYNGAMPFYERARDYASMVRLCCELGDITRAKTIINQHEPTSLGAAFHLASYYEDNQQVHKAIEFYKISETYHHALRLAKQHQMDEILIDIALKIPDSVLTSRSNPKEIAARYFEDIGDFSKAAMLYQKAGNINKAMDLCIEGQLFAELKNIAETLTETELDPSVAARFSEYFLKHEEYEKAVSMLIIANQYEKALSIVSDYGVCLTTELAEKLTPKKDAALYKAIVMNLAACLTQQQQYQLACKKYTQCGDKIEAIKCLIKAGDTQKVVYYASKTKNHNANILAANYLQSLDWHTNPKYTKHILQFYSAAKAYQQLAFFYDAMAQIEIDDYRDYDKALRALKQGYKQIKKASSSSKDKLMLFQQRIDLVNRFSCARKFAESDPDQMITICESLIQEPNLESAIRVGDVYALMVEYYHSINNMKDAYNVIQRMSQNNIILGPYLDRTMIQTIYNQVGADINEIQLDDDPIDETIDEDIVDDS